jgi:hypothetical protein
MTIKEYREKNNIAAPMCEWSAQSILAVTANTLRFWSCGTRTSNYATGNHVGTVTLRLTAFRLASTYLSISRLIFADVQSLARGADTRGTTRQNTVPLRSLK